MPAEGVIEIIEVIGVKEVIEVIGVKEVIEVIGVIEVKANTLCMAYIPIAGPTIGFNF